MQGLGVFGQDTLPSVPNRPLLTGSQRFHTGSPRVGPQSVGLPEGSGARSATGRRLACRNPSIRSARRKT